MWHIFHSPMMCYYHKAHTTIHTPNNAPNTECMCCWWINDNSRWDRCSHMLHHTGSHMHIYYSYSTQHTPNMDSNTSNIHCCLGNRLMGITLCTFPHAMSYWSGIWYTWLGISDIIGRAVSIVDRMDFHLEQKHNTLMDIQQHSSYHRGNPPDRMYNSNPIPCMFCRDSNIIHKYPIEPDTSTNSYNSMNSYCLTSSNQLNNLYKSTTINTFSILMGTSNIERLDHRGSSHSSRMQHMFSIRYLCSSHRHNSTHTHTPPWSRDPHKPNTQWPIYTANNYHSNITSNSTTTISQWLHHHGWNLFPGCEC